MASPHLSGLIAAPYTAFHPDYSLNLDAIPRQAEALIEAGVRGAFICGTTGEGLSLSLDERMQVAEQWRRAASGRLLIIVHVGHHCLSDSQALARHAQVIGADAIATVCPSFFKPADLEALVEWCAAVAGHAAELPFYYYHIPAFTGVRLPMPAFLQRAAGQIPQLAGVKFTDENLLEYGRCLALEGGRFDVLFGRDEILLAALAVGARGAVGSTYSLFAPVYQRLIAAFERGEIARARAAQATAQQTVVLMQRHGGLVAGKALMRVIGIDCGPPRPPLRALSAGAYEELSAGFAQLMHGQEAAEPSSTQR